MPASNRRTGMISIGRILLLILGVMFVGFFITMLTNSPLSEAIMQGFGLVDDETDYTVDVKDQETLSDLAMLSYHRASNDGCKAMEDTNKTPTVDHQNNGKLGFDKQLGWPEYEGYKHLKDSYLGRYPECYGASASGLRGVEETTTGIETGEDMEGIFSREKFVIKEKITIEDSTDNRESTWLESNFLVAFKDGFETVASDRSCNSPNNLMGVREQFALYFQTAEDVSSRAEPWGSDELSNRPYCGRDIAPNIARWGRRELLPVVDTEEPSTVTLCPGDKGYVQVNKFVRGGETGPTNSGEAGESGTGNAAKVAFIQITELGEACADRGRP